MKDQYELLDVNDCRNGQLEMFQPVDVDTTKEGAMPTERKAVARFRLRYHDENDFLIHERGSDSVRGIVFDDEPSILYVRFQPRLTEQDRTVYKKAMNEHYRDEFKELERFCLHNNIPRNQWEMKKPNVITAVKYYHERKGA